MATAQALSEATESLERMQKFDATTLARTPELGQKLHFAAAVPHAQKLVELYRRLSLSVLSDFPDGLLNQLKATANADYNRFKSILDFSSEQNNPGGVRDSLVEQLRAGYDTSFQQLWHYIAYGVSKTIDSQRLENESRAVLQSIQDQAAKVTTDLQNDKKTSESILGEIRKVAAEHGVSQQAAYFKSEADEHEVRAGAWESTTKKWAGGAITFAVLSVFVHEWPLLSPDNAYESAQLIASKVLIFGVLAYMLVLSGRNFLAHKHNGVVNRHRQNALLTYKAISDAAKAPDKQDVILSHAAACIFAPQDTGYQRSQVPADSAAPVRTVIDVVAKTASKAD